MKYHCVCTSVWNYLQYTRKISAWLYKQNDNESLSKQPPRARDIFRSRGLYCIREESYGAHWRTTRGATLLCRTFYQTSSLSFPLAFFFYFYFLFFIRCRGTLIVRSVSIEISPYYQLISGCDIWPTLALLDYIFHLDFFTSSETIADNASFPRGRASRKVRNYDDSLKKGAHIKLKNKNYFY